jgi:hypothetical protein
LRALSVLGEHNAAIEGARALAASQGYALQGDDAFLLSDLQVAADRHDDARRGGASGASLKRPRRRR